jgi:hypothetical protein
MKAAKETSGILLSCLAICGFLVASGIQAQEVVSPPPKIKPLVPPDGGVVLPIAPSPKPLPPDNKPIDISALPPDTNVNTAPAPSPEEDLLDDMTALPPLPLVTNTTTSTTDTSSSISISYTFPTFLVTLLSILAAMML